MGTKNFVNQWMMMALQFLNDFGLLQREVREIVSAGFLQFLDAFMLQQPGSKSFITFLLVNKFCKGTLISDLFDSGVLEQGCI